MAPIRALGLFIAAVLAVSQIVRADKDANFTAATLAICDPFGSGSPNIVHGTVSGDTIVAITNSQSGLQMGSCNLAYLYGNATVVSIACGDFLSQGIQLIAVYAGGSNVTVLNANGCAVVAQILLDSRVLSGAQVQLASGDVDGDGEFELIAAAGPAAASAHVGVYNVSTGLLKYDMFDAFSGASYANGVSVSAGDVNGDGVDDIAVGQLGANPLVRMLKYASGAFSRAIDVTSFQALAPFSTAGVRVAVCAAPPFSSGSVLGVPFARAKNAAVYVATLNSTLANVVSFADVTSPELASAVASSNVDVSLLVSGSQMTYPAAPSTATSKFVQPPLFPAFIATVDAAALAAANVAVPSAFSDVFFASASNQTAALKAADAGSPSWPSQLVNMPYFAPPPRNYKSPYYIYLSFANVTFDFNVGARGNRAMWAQDPSSQWYLPSNEARYTGWGPLPAQFPPVPSVDSLPAVWLQERYVASIANLVGWTDYQHHHVPVWVPSSDVWEWNPVQVGAHTSGLDCSDLTAWGWTYGFGLSMTAETADQGALAGVVAPWNGLFLNFQVVQANQSHYGELIAALQTGDMLYIKGCATCTNVTHVISWLGPTGKCAFDGECPPLVLDSYGFGIVDSNGIVVPSGPHIRPFLSDSWYFSSLSHVVRLIQPTGFNYTANAMASSASPVASATVSATTAAISPSTTSSATRESTATVALQSSSTQAHASSASFVPASSTAVPPPPILPVLRSSGSSLSGGAIAGIVIGCVVGVALIALGACYCARGRRLSGPRSVAV